MNNSILFNWKIETMRYVKRLDDFTRELFPNMSEETQFRNLHFLRRQVHLLKHLLDGEAHAHAKRLRKWNPAGRADSVNRLTIPRNRLKTQYGHASRSRRTLLQESSASFQTFVGYLVRRVVGDQDKSGTDQGRHCLWTARWFGHQASAIGTMPVSHRVDGVGHFQEAIGPSILLFTANSGPRSLSRPISAPSVQLQQTDGEDKGCYASAASRR